MTAGIHVHGFRSAGFAIRRVAACLIGSVVVAATMPNAQAQLVADFAAPDIRKEIVAEHAAIAPADGDGFAPVRFNPSGSPAVQLLALRRPEGKPAAAFASAPPAP